MLHLSKSLSPLPYPLQNESPFDCSEIKQYFQVENYNPWLKIGALAKRPGQNPKQVFASSNRKQSNVYQTGIAKV
jgi:hypothetical protein